MLVTTCLYPVLYIPKSNSRLLSLGEFMQQGLSVIGDLRHISMTYKNKPVITCNPLNIAHTLYWLDATIIMVEQQHLACSSIYSVDYNIMHRCLVACEVKNKGFPF